MKRSSKNGNLAIVLRLWTGDCTQFGGGNICCCECQWTAAEQSRMQLVTVHPDVLRAALAIITSNCHLLIYTGLRISFIYVLLIRNLFALMQFQSLKELIILPLWPWVLISKPPRFILHNIGMECILKVTLRRKFQTAASLNVKTWVPARDRLVVYAQHEKAGIVKTHLHLRPALFANKDPTTGTSSSRTPGKLLSVFTLAYNTLLMERGKTQRIRVTEVF